MYKQKKSTSSSKFSARSTQNYWLNKSKPASTRGNSHRSGGFNRGGRRTSGRRSFGEEIDISRFIQKSKNFTKEPEAPIEHIFADFKFCNQIMDNLKRRNFSTPTAIQDQAIEHIKNGKDIVGLASTGTGKTAAFLLPMIEKVFKDRGQNVLIITPTRELALQIETEFRLFSANMKIYSATCVGGAAIYKQINNLKRSPNFVIGTPGRLKDLNQRGILNFGKFQNVILDEVDRMLDMGFIDDVREMLNQVGEVRQSLFFSATMPPKIKDLILTFSSDPIIIETKVGQASENVEQDIVKIRDKAMKLAQLKEILSESETLKALIFIETKAEVEKVTGDLIRSGFKAESLHGDKKQHQRQKALTQFRTSSIDILVATDVAARGLDIDGISHVINYTVPQTYDDYIHRIGRTGRGQHKGFAYTFVE